MRTGMGSPLPRARAQPQPHTDEPGAGSGAHGRGASGGRAMLRLRALAEKGPLPLDPLLQMVADGALLLLLVVLALFCGSLGMWGVAKVPYGPCSQP